MLSFKWVLWTKHVSRLVIVAAAILVAVTVEAQTYLMSNGSTTTCSGTFYDSGGAGSNHGNGENFTYTICPLDPTEPTTITFNSFRLEGCCDFLTIYDGSTTTTSLGTYSGTSANGQSFTSTDVSGCLTFVFTSDGSVTRSGWEASVSCVKTEFPITDGVTDLTCSGTFYDTGGASGNYSGNEHITYTICPNVSGQVSQVDFTSFSMHITDTLYIYDGNDTSELIGAYNNGNSANGQTFTSSDPSGCLTFLFDSNGAAHFAGWEATISCVVPTGVITDATTDNLCSGSFWDSGVTGDYSNNENITYTICPSTPGLFVDVSFDFFDVQANQDFLAVYDGPTTGSPLINTFSNGNYTSGLQIRSTDASGCLTFHFTSNGSTTSGGWNAEVNCLQPCQAVNASITGSTPSADIVTNEIQICQSGTVDFVGAGVYPQNNTFYNQTDATSLFEWDFGDGATQSGIGLTNVSHTYADGEGYYVQLNITDNNNCRSTNILDQQVAVSTTPEFAGTLTDDADFCLGESANLTGVVSPVPFTYDCSPASEDSLQLPDGIGISYTATTTLSCFSAGQTLTNVSEITGICVNMEHTWSNDLDVTIICPSGQSVVVDSYGGVGNETFLGEPIDGDEGAPVSGVGWDYCWSPSPTYGTWNAEAATYDTLPSGSYASENTLTGLVGCELNGVWALVITDNLAQDNGFIFSFDMDLNSAAPAPWSYTPSVDTEAWSGPSTINNPGNNPISVTPDGAGNSDYVYTITDDFGCSYDTTISLTVTAPPDAGGDSTLYRCTNDAASDLFDAIVGSPAAGGTWSGPSALTNGDQGTFDPGTMNAGVYTYTLTATAPCTDQTASVTVVLNDPATANAGPATSDFCMNNSFTNAATATNYDSLLWTSSGDGTFVDDAIEDAVYTPGSSDISNGTVTLTLLAYGSGNCANASDAIVLTIIPDTDGDGICDDVDIDDDDDGIPDLEEVGSDPLIDGDGDDVPFYLDDNDSNGAIGNVDGLVESGFDTDGDNVPDHFDLDSDNDGIFDVVEAGHGEDDFDLNGRIDIGSGSFGSNGLYNSVETSADSGVLSYTIADSDTDGNIDSQELDSDNDGCNDVDEAGYLDQDDDGLLGN